MRAWQAAEEFAVTTGPAYLIETIRAAIPDLPLVDFLMIAVALLFFAHVINVVLRSSVVLRSMVSRR